ncbi:endonuclease V [Thermoplasmatales archaeon AK]|nr:endonuclease V [Thermoplasmatales archaeon AK]
MENSLQSGSDFHRFDLYSFFYNLIRQIPAGMVSTYGDIARALGDISAAKACAYMISISQNDNDIPFHRVIRSDGLVWKFTSTGFREEKVSKLREEGIETDGSRVLNFEAVRFNNFESDAPLQKMRSLQEQIASMVSLEDSDCMSDTIGAVDVSYDDAMGYGSFVWQDSDGIHSRETILPVRFPYIPGYLAFREFQFIEDLCRGFKGLLLVDANGYLHPRRVGLASYAGVMLGIQTIGVAKSLLMGEVSDNYVYLNGQKVGYIYNRHFIVSPGHKISLKGAVRTISKLFNGEYPHLLKLAHRNSVLIRRNHSSDQLGFSARENMNA